MKKHQTARADYAHAQTAEKIDTVKFTYFQTYNQVLLRCFKLKIRSSRVRNPTDKENTRRISMSHATEKTRSLDAKKPDKIGLFGVNIFFIHLVWLGRRGSNPRMTESKSVALPLGYFPTTICIITYYLIMSRKTERKQLCSRSLLLSNSFYRKSLSV